MITIKKDGIILAEAELDFENDGVNALDSLATYVDLIQESLLLKLPTNNLTD